MAAVATVGSVTLEQTISLFVNIQSIYKDMVEHYPIDPPKGYIAVMDWLEEFAQMDLTKFCPIKVVHIVQGVEPEYDRSSINSYVAASEFAEKILAILTRIHQITVEFKADIMSVKKIITLNAFALNCLIGDYPLIVETDSKGITSFPQICTSDNQHHNTYSCKERRCGIHHTDQLSDQYGKPIHCKKCYVNCEERPHLIEMDKSSILLKKVTVECVDGLCGINSTQVQCVNCWKASSIWIIK
jgi:hypothetical protein